MYMVVLRAQCILFIEDVLTPDEIEATLEASKRLHKDTDEVWRQIGKGFSKGTLKFD